MKFVIVALGVFIVTGCASNPPSNASTTGIQASSGAVVETAPTNTEKAATSAAQTAAATMAEAVSSVKCTKGKDERTLSISKPEGKACELTYTKQGEGKMAADARSDATYCTSVLEKIKANLEASGYVCK